MRYLLDTNTCIKAMRGATSVVSAMSSCVPSDLCISSITAYELFTGVEKCADATRERKKVDTFVRLVRPILFDMAAAMQAGRIRAELESRGEMIGPYDVLIAAHALALGLTLITDNTQEFQRVAGLTIENW